MVDSLGLTASELDEVERAYQGGVGFVKNLEHHFLIYQGLIDDLDNYRLSNHDFSNQVSYRFFLENVIAELSDGTKAKVRKLLDGLDERFMELTRKMPRHTGWFEMFGKHPWADRVPIHLDDEYFEQYLKMLEEP